MMGSEHEEARGAPARDRGSPARPSLRTRLRYKSYWKLPFNLGEVQYGHISRSVVVWLRGRRFIVKRGDPKIIEDELHVPEYRRRRRG